MAQKTYTEQCLETLVDLVDLQRKSSEKKFDELAKAIEALAVNLGQLTVQQKTTANNIEALGQAVKDQNAAIRETNVAINGHLAVAQSQSANIAELTRLATVIISRSA
jgi:hypothetical protein